MTKFNGRIAALALAAVVVPGAAHAESFGGQAQAISGDALIVGGREVRLHGIQAPDAAQRCDSNGTTWRCGDAARERLAALVVGRQVQCIGTGQDARGRATAVCAAGLTDLNRTMTELGLASAIKGRGDAYIPVQARAQARGLGIWINTHARNAGPALAFNGPLK